MVITLHLKSKKTKIMVITSYLKTMILIGYFLWKFIFQRLILIWLTLGRFQRFKETQVESKHIVIIKLWGSLIHMHLPRANQQTSFNLFLFQGMVKSVKPVICGLDLMTLTFIACLSVFSSFLLFWCMWIFVLTDAVSRFRSFHK